MESVKLTEVAGMASRFTRMSSISLSLSMDGDQATVNSSNISIQESIDFDRSERPEQQEHSGEGRRVGVYGVGQTVSKAAVTSQPFHPRVQTWTIIFQYAAQGGYLNAPLNARGTEMASLVTVWWKSDTLMQAKQPSSSCRSACFVRSSGQLLQYSPVPVNPPSNAKRASGRHFRTKHRERKEQQFGGR